MEEQTVPAPVIRAAAGVAIIAGVWLILSPWILPGGYPATGKWDNMAAGIVVIAVMVIKSAAPEIRWPSWAGILLGLWVMFSPWILRHASHEVAERNEVATATVLILASWAAALATMYGLGPPQILQEGDTSSGT